MRNLSPERLASPTLRLAGRGVPVVGRARVYICGITPYDVTHLGHAATFVWADAAAAVLRATGVETTVCRNITDVDDVLTRAARERGEPYDEFAAIHTYAFDRDMAELRVRRPAHEPRARTHVLHVVQLTAALLAAEAAYVRGGSVYFRGAHVADLAGLSREEALRLAREFGDAPDDPQRDDPLDVPVWQASDADEPWWPSPWGDGRPGWHAECAAMALTVHGAAVDLLAGGAELHFPHHAYQAAIAEAVTGVSPFARSHLPVGTVRVAGAKMAKSTGNLVLVSDVLREHDPAVLRLLLLDRPWAADWDYSPDLLDPEAGRLEALYRAAGRPAASAAGADHVLAALTDDLDIPAAVDVATEAGGEAARLLLRVLALD